MKLFYLILFILPWGFLYAIHPEDIDLAPQCLEMGEDDISWFYDRETQVLCVHGTISQAFAYAFEEDMFPREVSLVVLNSRGGTLFGAIEVAEVIRNRNIPTYIPQGAVCNSNCALVFSAGVERYIHPETEVGIHFVWSPIRVNDQGEHEIYVNNKLTYERYLKQLELYTGSHLYNQYIDEMLSRGLIKPEQVSLERWKRSRDLDSGISFARASFWYLDSDYLLDQNIATQVIY